MVDVFCKGLTINVAVLVYSLGLQLDGTTLTSEYSLLPLHHFIHSFGFLQLSLLSIGLLGSHVLLLY